MTAPIHVHLWACAVVAMMFVIGAAHGRTIQLNWTSDGVRDYTSTPLRLALGDTLELTCRNVSNLFIQTDRNQYDNCNASAGSGAIDYNGFCFSGSLLRLSLRQNSQDLDHTVNFENNRVYFLTSYSEGSFRANDATFTSGGQCEDGLKMIFVIGQATVPPVGGGGGDDSGVNQDGGTGQPLPDKEGLSNKPSGRTTGVSLPIIAGAAAGGVVLVAGLLIMVIIIIVCVKRGHCSRETRTKSSTTYGNSSTASYYNESVFRSEPDSQVCTLTRADFNLGSKPGSVMEIKVQETTQQSHDDISLQTFGQKKSASIDYLCENQHYKSAERGFDDATGQSSTPFRVNPTPEHLLKAQSTLEIFSGKPKPLPKPRQNNMYKSSSADNLI